MKIGKICDDRISVLVERTCGIGHYKRRPDVEEICNMFGATVNELAMRKDLSKAERCSQLGTRIGNL